MRVIIIVIMVIMILKKIIIRRRRSKRRKELSLPKLVVTDKGLYVFNVPSPEGG
jgi:hypothetical protein